jgi:hypothetical protein
VEITLDITKPQLVEALQSLPKHLLMEVIMESLDTDDLTNTTLLDLTSDILKYLLKVYTDELEYYTGQQLNSVFGATHPTTHDHIPDCELYVTATKNAIQAIRIIRDGFGSG